jgi:hypothetical protein
MSGEVPGRARVSAARLAALFWVEIVARLNDARSRLRDANKGLWSGLAPDALGRVDDAAAAAGGSPMARLMGDALGGGGRGSRAVVLGVLEEIYWQVHEAFCRYRFSCEERRQLAVDAGELSWQLTECCALPFGLRTQRAPRTCTSSPRLCSLSSSRVGRVLGRRWCGRRCPSRRASRCWCCWRD